MINGKKQTETGKAFEFACAYSLYTNNVNYNVKLQWSPQMLTASKAFENLSKEEQLDYSLAADAATKIIKRLEPMLRDPHELVEIGIQPDSAGISGDVRDVVCIRGDSWELGFSCKHNHNAVKHSRLSDTIDFGKEWFGIPCSEDYFNEVKKIFTPLRRIRDDSKAEGKPAKWDMIKDKEDECYVPVLKAFMAELIRLDNDNKGEIPQKLIRYLVGINDFYKIIMNSGKRYTTIEAVNIGGTLNKKSNGSKPIIDVPVLKLPTKFYEVGFKDNSKTTIIIVCDQGWNISMRIHNASSKIEPSLKFDVQLLAMPSSMLTQIEPWGV